MNTGILGRIAAVCHQHNREANWMTTLLEKAVEKVRGLPPAVQDDLARVLLQFAGEEQAATQLTAAEEASFEVSLAQEERGEFATDAQVRAIWAKHGL
jgi:hypothetical protein